MFGMSLSGRAGAWIQLESGIKAKWQGRVDSCLRR